MKLKKLPINTNSSVSFLFKIEGQKIIYNEDLYQERKNFSNGKKKERASFIYNRKLELKPSMFEQRQPNTSSNLVPRFPAFLSMIFASTGGNGIAGMKNKVTSKIIESNRAVCSAV